MKPVPESKLAEIGTPILEARIRESNLEEIADVNHILSVVAAGYASRNISVFVDDIIAPKSCLTVGVGNNPVEANKVCHVMLIWIKPEHRGDAALLDDMKRTLEAYAEMNGCASISGSSWVYLGSTDIDALWNSWGYDLQEKVFVKRLDS